MMLTLFLAAAISSDLTQDQGLMHPIAVTIRELRADPVKYDEKLVRVRGWVNECAGLNCSIDEQKSEARNGRGARISIGQDDLLDEAVRGRLPSYVVIDGGFSAYCFTKAVCLDRAPELGVMRFALDATDETIPTRD